MALMGRTTGVTRVDSLQRTKCEREMSRVPGSRLRSSLSGVISLFTFLSGVYSLSPDGEALLAFKASLIAENGSFLSDWDASDVTPCNWTGITCSEDHVVGIELPGLNINGTISDRIGDVKTLQIINLGLDNETKYYNNFVGSIPSSIFTLSELQYLDLSWNWLNGSIPSGFQNLVNLKHLDLNTNLLTGGIPEDFANQTTIEYLDLSGNNDLQGTIPSGIGSLTNLTFLNINQCGLTGELPPSLGNLKQLQTLYLQNNSIDGPIPGSFGGMDSLDTLDISMNNLTSIPPELGNLQRIRVMRLYQNNISGQIHETFGNMNRTLVNLDLSTNQLSGNLPETLGSLSLLLLLHLSVNRLTGPLPAGMADMTVLQDLSLYDNSFTGELPQTWGQKNNFIKLDVTSNNFSGPIPPDLCSKGQLERLILTNNSFTGSIPDSLGSCPTLFRLRLDSNMLNGSIPKSLGLSQSLNVTEFSNNELTGTIPPELGNCSGLQSLSLSGNRLSGEVPPELGNIANLIKFEAAENNLTGNIPVELCSTKVAYIDLSSNKLSGEIPPNISTCQYLTQLFLEENRLSGIIPPSFADMISLHELSLAHNLLIGPIPYELANSNLQTLDLSYNNLSGQVSRDGFFASLNVSDFAGNPNLCTSDPELLNTLSPCFSQGVPDDTRTEHHTKSRRNLVLWTLTGILLALVSSIGICCCCCYWERFMKVRTRKRSLKKSWSITMFHKVPDLTLGDILDSLDEDNLVGSGGSGKVYRGEIRAGKVFRGRPRMEDHPFVVKKLRGCITKHGVNLYDHGFKAEVETLGNIRHTNIVKLLACCANNDTNLLVYESMANGSLADQLHGPKGGLLEWETRLRIALGAAQGLSYLHHDCVPAILHRDVKTHNILLDEDFNARLADFGLAKLLLGIERMHTMSNVVGSHGYIPPELAFSMKANDKSDVYSYGVVLLELVTGRRAVEGVEGENEGEDLVMWIQWKIREKEGMIGALDKRLGHISEDTQEEMMMTLRIGLFCTNASPNHRPCMRDVVRMLIDVKASSIIPMGGGGKTKAKTEKSTTHLPALSVPVNYSLPPLDLIQISP